MLNPVLRPIWTYNEGTETIYADISGNIGHYAVSVTTTADLVWAAAPDWPTPVSRTGCAHLDILTPGSVVRSGTTLTVRAFEAASMIQAGVATTN